MQVRELCRSDRVDVVRRGCCTLLPHFVSSLTLECQPSEPCRDRATHVWMPAPTAVRFAVNKILTVASYRTLTLTRKRQWRTGERETFSVPSSVV
jgi:hypothetical protein